MAGMEGQDGKRRIALDETLAQRHPPSHSTEAPGSDQTLLVTRVKHQNVVGIGRVRLDTDLLC